jgi:hypothetical protein
MKTTVKRIISFRFNQYKDIELKLEKMAQKGLFLEEIRLAFWTFKKGEPRKVKYTVTYFSEASMFNPTETDNQQTYFDYAKESGWNFVAQFNQMQVFVSENENPIPFETDDSEKLANIKKCMTKNFLPSTTAMILVFLLNLVVQFNSYRLFPTDFFATNGLLLVAAMLATMIYFIYMLLSYFVWCKQSEKSINMGGGCIEKTNIFNKIINAILLIFPICIMSLFIFDIAANNLFILVLGSMQLPIVFIIFWSSIKLLKKKKQSATINKLVSYSLLTIVSFAYIAFTMIIIVRFDILSGDQRPYRIVTWQLTPTESRDYKQYSDNIPMKSEDLYGSIDYQYYSYEKNIDNSFFLIRSDYRQYSLPAKDSPPRVEYTIIEPKLDFVYDIVARDLKKVPEWSDKKIEPLDNEIFGTEEAYQFYYDMDGTGNYLLFYKDKIIQLNLEEPATVDQISVIKKKLELH